MYASKRQKFLLYLLNLVGWLITLLSQELSYSNFFFKSLVKPCIAANVFWLERHVRCLERCAPIFGELLQSRRSVSVGKYCGFSVSFRFDQNINALVGLAQGVGSLECNIKFTGLFCLLNELFQSLSVAIRAIEKKERVKILTLYVAVFRHGKLTAR